MRRLIGLAVLLAALVAAPAGQALTAAAPCPGTAKAGPYQHVVVWMLENHSLSQSRGHMPYLDGVANQCGYFTHDSAITHPSLPNYLAITGGSTFGVTDDASPASHKIGAASIFGQLGSHWGSFHQSMPKNCDLTDARPYIVHHNPAAYYTQIRTACQSQDVPITQLQGALSDPATAPRYVYVVPDNCHNGHSNPCGTDTLAQADGYLKTELPVILNSPTYQDGHTIVFVTFDEGNSGSQLVYTVAIAPSIHAGTVYSLTATHYSILRYAEGQLGLACLQKACTAPSISGAPGL